MGGLAKGDYQIIIYKKLWLATKEEFKESHLKDQILQEEFELWKKQLIRD